MKRSLQLVVAFVCLLPAVGLAQVTIFGAGGAGQEREKMNRPQGRTSEEAGPLLAQAAPPAEPGQPDRGGAGGGLAGAPGGQGGQSGAAGGAGGGLPDRSRPVPAVDPELVDYCNEVPRSAGPSQGGAPKQRESQMMRRLYCAIYLELLELRGSRNTEQPGHARDGAPGPSISGGTGGAAGKAGEGPLGGGGGAGGAGALGGRGGAGGAGGAGPKQ